MTVKISEIIFKKKNGSTFKKKSKTFIQIFFYFVKFWPFYKKTKNQEFDSNEFFHGIPLFFCWRHNRIVIKMHSIQTPAINHYK